MSPAPSARRGFGVKDALILAGVCAAAALMHLPVLIGGETYFSNDLSQVYHAWYGLSAELIQRGQAPLWNPYSYFGIPLLANMQTGIYYPLACLFQLFPFTRALGFFLWSSQALAALWTYLWLRRWGFGRAACAAGAAVFALGGTLVGYSQLPNLQATAAQAPALALFFGCLPAVAAIGALALFCGYPPVWGAMAAASFFLCALRGSGGWGRTLAGLAVALVLASALLVPGAEYFLVSSRSGGIPVEQRLNNSLRLEELPALASPALARRLSFLRQRPEPRLETLRWERGGVAKEFSFSSEYEDLYRDPSGIKFRPWVSFYAGGAGCLLALAGLIAKTRGEPKKAALWLAGMTAAALIALGGSNPISRALWTMGAPMSWLRGPARMSFLLLLGLVPAVAWGVSALNARKRRLGAFCAAALAAELLWIGRGYYPTMEAGTFSRPGELVEFLRGGLAGARYFQEPEAELFAYLDRDDASKDYAEFRKQAFASLPQKLFGVRGAVFHLPAGSGTYESLYPAAARETAEALRAATPERRPALMRWAGLRYWLTRGPQEETSLEYRGKPLWHAYELAEPVARAYWLPAALAKELERPFAEAPKTEGAIPFESVHAREDRLRIRGTAPEGGELFVSEPRYPGWRLWIDGQERKPKAALGGFFSAPVEKGEVSAVWLYRPGAWRLGNWLSVLAIVGGLALLLRTVTMKGSILTA